ncbi:PAS domain S-box protein [Piscinibacter aquaticus]|uniref:PAS domain S-box protein n=1 Tax=Piscinibacter aquaticus TaxID=392597 RepID=A0A5C6U178_9BURK|nr:PAS domain S-box protein [Piscinibacter aquaticus]
MVSLLLPSERVHEDAQLLEAIARGERVAPFDTVRRHRDGHAIAVSLTASPILDEGGRCVGMAKTLRDMREAQRSREALAALNASLEQQVADRTARLDMALRDLRAIIDAVPSMIGYWDRHLINRVANRAYGTWFGLDPQTLRGRHLPEVLGQYYEVQRPRVEAALRGEPQVFERSVPRQDGGVRHILCHYLPDVADGEVLGFYVMVHDVSEITESRLQLAAAQRDNAALLQTLDRFAMVSVADRSGRIVSVNEALCRLSGHAEAELIGHSQHVLDEQTNDAALLSDITQRLADGEPWRGEMRTRAKDGTIHWLDTIVAPFLDAQGRPRSTSRSAPTSPRSSACRQRPRRRAGRPRTPDASCAR